MDSSGVREHPQRSPPGPRAVKTGDLSRDTADDLFEVQEKRREEDELQAKMEERRLGADTDQAVRRAERESEESHQREEERERLEKECSDLVERKQEAQQEVQRHTVYLDFMERVAKLTKFKDAEQLSGHLESLLHFRGQLCQRESEAQEKADQQRKALLTLEDQHHLLRLHKINQLSQLQTELEKTRSETLTWERKWNHIQETAAKKTLLLGQIKMATLNLYEMTDDSVEGEEGVDMNDTEKQLEKAKMFVLDHEDIVKQHQSPSQRQNDGQKRAKAKKHIPAYC
ncbi:coiled-coil domain-containing protein 42 [Pempheris klunzingeri]|uniref:coiled-coil domain-containing protein 42 n=1 Tax=Pempheris klunzingeri TaxID=3127111 RepID=UPI00397FF789